MVMVLNETRHSGGYIISESSNLYHSRDAGTFYNNGTADLVVQAGLVLASGAEPNAVSAAKAGNTGNATIGSVAFGPSTTPGVYTITMTSATAFSVTAPNGAVLGTGVAGTTFTDPQIAFKITAGSTPCVAGDSFTITISPSDISYIPWVNNGPAVAIMYNTDIVAAGVAARITVSSRNCEVNGAELVWDQSISGASNFSALQAAAYQQLRAVGIIVR